MIMPATPTAFRWKKVRKSANVDVSTSAVASGRGRGGKLRKMLLLSASTIGTAAADTNAGRRTQFFFGARALWLACGT